MTRRARGMRAPGAQDGLDEEQRALQQNVIEFAQGELNDGLERRDHEATFPRELWSKCAEIGLLGLPVPVAYGGAGAGATTVAAALEGLGYGCADNGLIFSLNAQMWAVEHPIATFGSEEQKRRYLPGLSDGSLVAGHAMTEPGSGSDALSLATTAVANDAGWVLNGSKTFVTNGPDSDLFVVFAATDRSLGFAGLSGFLVERDAKGLEVGGAFSKMGLRSSHLSELFLTDCVVPHESMLASPGAGMAIFNTAMRWERGLILASAVGTMRRQVERCLDYAGERVQFGQPIGAFQAVSHRIADMRLRLETSRLMLYRMARLLESGAATDLDAALTKLHLSESFVESSLAALQIHGGYGYMTEYGLERDVRDALASRIYSGTSEMQRNVVARHMGL